MSQQSTPTARSSSGGESPAAAVQDGAVPEARTKGSRRRNLALRLLTGLPAFAALLALMAWGPMWAVALVVGGAGVWGYHEYLTLDARSGRRVGSGDAPRGRRTHWVLLGAAALPGVGGLMGTPTTLGGLLLAGLLICLWMLWFAPAVREPARAPAVDGMRNLGVPLAGLLFVPWMINHLTLLVWLPDGRALSLFLVLVVSMNDTFAYFVGTALGRHKLAPTISPNKSIEGALGGIAGGVLAGWIAQRWLLEGTGWPPGAVLALGAVLAVVAQAGDLTESKLKRIQGADDSGWFMPGHGGMLDRLDAFLLTAPTLYYLVRMLES